MAEVNHASDCALHNAPAAAPEPCSCGAEGAGRAKDEIVARALCASIGIEPDAPFVRGEPCRVWGGYIVSSEPKPAWQAFLREAGDVLRALAESAA